jgi:phosphonate transport system substrate-binding protein
MPNKGPVMRFLHCCLLIVATLSSVGRAAAEWRDEIGTFRIAIAANGDPAVAALRAEPFRLAVEAALGMPVEIVPARDYSSLMDAAARSRIEYAVLPATAYAATYAFCECIEPIVIASSGDGSAGFRMHIYTRQGGPANLAGLQGKKIAIFDDGTIGGELLASHELGLQGLDLSQKQPNILRFATSQAAMSAFVDGDADALLGWAPEPNNETSTRGTPSAIRQNGGGDIRAVSIWQSTPIPHRVHAVRRNIDGEAKMIIRALLADIFATDPVAYDSIEPIYGGGFIAARQAQFETLAAAFRQTGLSAASAEQK